MLTYFVLWILVLLIGTIVCFKILRSIAKTIAIAGFILLLFIVITLTLAYSDIQKLKQDIAEQEIVFLIHRDNTLIFSAVEYNVGDNPQYKELEMSTEELQNLLTKKQYKDALNSDAYDNVVSINTEVYDVLAEKTAMLAILHDTSMSFESRAEALHELNDALIEHDTRYLIQQYKRGHIVVYPKILTLSIIDILPESWLTKLVVEKKQD